MRLNRSQVIALGLFGGLAAWMLSGAFADPQPEAPVATQAAAVVAPKVRVATFKAEEITREVTVRGSSEAVRVVELKAETAGRVVEILVAKGARIDQGSVIARLAMDDRPARLAELKAIIVQRERELNAAASLAQRGFGPDLRASEARAQLESARAALSRLEIEIANTEIRAPIAGYLDERVIEVGAYLKVGDKVATMVDIDTILIVGSVTEREIPHLAVGRPGSALLVTGQEIDGRIRFVSTVADPATRTFRVELEAPNPNASARAGVTADMRLPLDTVRGHRVSPAILTLDDAGKLGVKAVGDDDKVQFLPVRILSDSAEAMWLGGLPSTVRLITVGQEYVVPGQSVTPVEQAE